MAKISRYESSKSLSTEGQGVQVNPSAAGAAGREITAAGQALQTIGQKFQKLNAQSEVNDATSRSMTELNQLELDAQKDQNLHRNVPAYQKRADEIRKKYSDQISDPATRMEFEGQLSNQTLTTMTKLTIDGRKQGLAHYRGSVFNYGEMLRKRYMTGDESKMGDAQRMIALGSLREAYQKGVQTGAYTPEEAAKEVEQFEKQAKIGRAMYDMEKGVLSHTIIADKLAKNTYEIDDPKVLLELQQRNKSIQESRDEQQELDLLIRQSATASNFVKAESKGEFDIDQVFEAKRNGDLTDRQAKVLDQLYISKDKHNAQDDAVEYSKVFKKYREITGKKHSKKKAAKAMFEDLAALRNDIIEAHANGALTKEKYAIWNDTIDKAYDDKLSGKFDEMNRIKNSGFDWFGLRVDRLIKDKTDQAEAKMFLSDALMQALSEDDEPLTPQRVSELSQGIFQGFLRQEYPGLVGAKEVTNSIASKENGVKIIYEADSEAKGDRSVKEPVVKDVVMVGQDGRTFKIPQEQAEEAKKAGLKIKPKDTDGDD